jgi:hypothetical protein
MSDEHDPHETTDARLTEAQVKSLYFRLSHDENVEAGAAYSENRQLTLGDVRALLADRAALLAEVARLQAQWERAEEAFENAIFAQVDLDKDIASRDAQIAAMRPLVELVADPLGKLVFWDTSRSDRRLYRWRCLLFCSGTGSGPLHFQHDEVCFVTQARALVATWAAGQTPAAPTPEPDWRDDADELKWLSDPDDAPDGQEGGNA